MQGTRQKIRGLVLIQFFRVERLAQKRCVQLAFIDRRFADEIESAREVVEELTAIGEELMWLVADVALGSSPKALSASCPKGSERRFFSMLTTRANTKMGSIHDRMPVILRNEDLADYMDETRVDLLNPWEGELFTPKCQSTLKRKF